MPVDAVGVCCERCPEATLASTRHIARRRLLKAAVFHPQPQAHADTATPPGGQEAAPHPGTAGAGSGRDRDGNGAPQPRSADLGASANGWHPAADRDSRRRPDTAPGPRLGSGGLDARLGVLPGAANGSRHHAHSPRYAPAAAYGSGNLYRAVTGQVIDASPQVLVIGDGSDERRFALTSDTRAWRGGPLEPAALSRGDIATIRLLPGRSNVADRIWANIGRVTGIIAGRDGDRLLVTESRSKPPQAVIIPAHARVKVQVRYPNLQRGYLLDIIGVRRDGYLEGLLPANSQPPYRSDLIPGDRQQAGRTAEAIAGCATWHDFGDEPYGVLGVSYPAVDPSAICREDSIAGYSPGQAPAYRELPYMAVGSVLNVRNECTGISGTLPITTCAPMTRLFNDRCVACANSPRGRIADLTVATFVALGGELEQGCFSTTLTIGR